MTGALQASDFLKVHTVIKPQATTASVDLSLVWLPRISLCPKSTRKASKPFTMRLYN
jgi:hypothetical protein